MTLILSSLTRTLYEPLRGSSDRALTLKTVFLLALASTKRVGELHGPSFGVKHSRGWSLVSFEFVFEFVAKTQSPSVPDDRFESFVDFVGDDPSEMLLCPVQALQYTTI